MCGPTRGPSDEDPHSVAFWRHLLFLLLFGLPQDVRSEGPPALHPRCVCCATRHPSARHPGTLHVPVQADVRCRAAGAKAGGGLVVAPPARP
mmetsp:Transcript_59379/g.186386  ORF Transcript_59379/g.186386 Transcript_59379/m.186386 type:complete len:92 (-) Transcript_59379:154-429(-)